MDIETFSFSAACPPLSVIITMKLAEISASFDASASPDSTPTFIFSNGQELHGTYVLLRYIGRVSNGIPNLYGQNAFESSQIDEWLEHAAAIKADSMLKDQCKDMDKYLEKHTYFAGHSLSIADIAIRFALEGIGLRWKILRRSKKYPNLVRWLNTVVTYYRTVLNKVKTTYIDKKGSEEQSENMSKKDQQLAPDQVKDVNWNVSERIERGCRGPTEVDLQDAEVGKVRLVFATEPNCCLHIGDIKQALLIKYFVDRYQGQVIVRFNDTNPAEESEKHEDILLKDIDTLCIKYEQITYASDYFSELMEVVEYLIFLNKAYVDDTPREQMRKGRKDGIESKCRKNSVEKNFRLWKEMIAGSTRGLQCCVRGKLDMHNSNETLRDPVYYRCNLCPHQRTGSKYIVYPTYDFACPYIDARQGITHALRNWDYHPHNAQYYQIQEDMEARKVPIHLFSGLAFFYTPVSKKQLWWFVQNGIVDGWDDPRLPTVQGIVHRGFKIEVLANFIIMQETSKRKGKYLDWHSLWEHNKKIVYSICPRHTAVIADSCVLLTLTNGPEETFVRIIPRRKKYAAAGERAITYTKRIWIDRADAESIAVGEKVSLMDWGNTVVNEIERDPNGNLTGLSCALHLERPIGIVTKTKVKLCWLPDTDQLVSLTLVEFDYLFTKKKISEREDFINVVNPCTRKETLAFGDSNMRNLQRGEILKLEKKGLFKCEVPFIRPSEPIVLFALHQGMGKHA